MTNKVKTEQTKKENLNGALSFVKEMVGMKTPKKTILVSVMAQNKIDVRAARKLYADTKRSMQGHKNRH